MTTSPEGREAAVCATCGKVRDEHIEILGLFYCYEFTRETSGEDASAKFQPAPAAPPPAAPVDYPLCAGGNAARFTRPVRPTYHCGDPSCACMARRPDVLAEQATCEQCGQVIVSSTTGIIAGDCAFCGGRMVATKGAWTRTNFPEEG